MKAPDWPISRPFVHRGWLGLLSAVTVCLFAQDLQHPASGYLEARLTTGLDAGYTKVGAAFQVTALSPWSSEDCTLLQGAAIYGKVVAATKHSKSSPESTLAFQIDSADCQHRRRAPIALHVLEIVVPDDPRNPLMGALPRNGSTGMQADVAANAMAGGHSGTAQEPSSIRVGAVLGENSLNLYIAGGPRFADVLYSDKHNVGLLPGTRLILGIKEMIPADQQLHLHRAGQEP